MDLAVMSSWDGTAEVYPYMPSSSTQQQNEERETLLDNSSISQNRERTATVGLARPKRKWIFL